MTASTDCRVDGRTRASSLRTRETVPVPTPAARAIWSIVTFFIAGNSIGRLVVEIHGDVLELCELVDRLDAVEAAEAAQAVAAGGRFDACREKPVDVDAAGIELRRDVQGAAHAAGPDGRGEAEWRVVGQRHG